MSTESHPVVSATPSSRSATSRLLVLLVSVAVAAAAYTWVTLHFTYSEGERVGYARKLSKRGWICKTWEGELAMANTPGSAETLFKFTVADDGVAQQVRALEGARVALLYEERKGVPSSCFGDTPYHVMGVRKLDSN